jgi:Flagellar hook capping protein
MTTPITNNTPTNTASSSSSSTSDSRTALATNFQTFLTLLTTQLQNQDPTSPMDTNQFTQQLVMYSQVEQQLSTNDKLDSLISLGSNQTSNLAMSYLGKKVTLTDGSGQLSSGAAAWTYGLDNDAKTTVLSIKDSTGKVVYSTSGKTAAGTYGFTWDGKTNQGDTCPDGVYTFTVSSTDTSGKAVSTSVASSALVSGIDLSGSTPQLFIGSSEVPLSSAVLVTN